LIDVTTDMVITREETFGPVATLHRFKSEANAVKMANDTPTLPLPRERKRERKGLASYFYSRVGIISAEIALFGAVTGRRRRARPMRAPRDRQGPEPPSEPTLVGWGQTAAPAVRR
jgi:hypothetical protein